MSSIINWFAGDEYVKPFDTSILAKDSSVYNQNAAKTPQLSPIMTEPEPSDTEPVGTIPQDNYITPKVPFLDKLTRPFQPAPVQTQSIQMEPMEVTGTFEPKPVVKKADPVLPKANFNPVMMSSKPITEVPVSRSPASPDALQSAIANKPYSDAMSTILKGLENYGAAKGGGANTQLKANNGGSEAVKEFGKAAVENEQAKKLATRQDMQDQLNEMKFQTETTKSDPKSEISIQLRAYLNSIGMKVPDTASFRDIEEIAPWATKKYDSEQQRISKVEARKESEANMMLKQKEINGRFDQSRDLKAEASLANSLKALPSNKVIQTAETAKNAADQIIMVLNNPTEENISAIGALLKTAYEGAGRATDLDVTRYKQAHSIIERIRQEFGDKIQGKITDTQRVRLIDNLTKLREFNSGLLSDTKNSIMRKVYPSYIKNLSKDSAKPTYDEFIREHLPVEAEDVLQNNQAFEFARDAKLGKWEKVRDTNGSLIWKNKSTGEKVSEQDGDQALLKNHIQLNQVK